jgi:hypothetical protein
MTKAETIAKGLGFRERKAIMNARGDADRGYWFKPGTARGVPQELKVRSIDGHYLSETGLEVRALLKGQDHG